jgi:ribosomal protein L14E/L6E/L27E
MRGEFVTSLSGHDRGKVYIIIEEHEDFLMLSDGRLKPLEKLKKKNPRHVQIVKKHTYNKEIIEKLERNEKVLNEEIKRAIKLYTSSVDKDMFIGGSDVEG